MDEKNITDVPEFTVSVSSGDVYINGEFAEQLCFSPESIGMAIANWLNEK